MNDQWKPSLHIWLFKDAPEELRRLSLFGDGTEELIIYVPPELCSLFENGDWVMAMPPAFWFLSKPPKREGFASTRVTISGRTHYTRYRTAPAWLLPQAANGIIRPFEGLSLSYRRCLALALADLGLTSVQRRRTSSPSP